MDSAPSTSPSGFVVYIYQSEIDVIHKYAAAQRQHSRRVGDLFGLWTSSGNVVVHLAETSVRVAVGQELEVDLKTYFVDKHMLCHIGKWQCDPSATSTNPGDLSRITVGSYCGRGKGYESCVLLSFCDRSNENVQTYLFLNGGTERFSATLKILSGNTKSSDEISDNPLRNVPAIREMLEKRKTVEEKCKQHPVEGHGQELSGIYFHGHNSAPITKVTYIGQNVNTRAAANASSIEQTRQSGNNSGNLISLNNSASSRCEVILSRKRQTSALHPSSETPATFLPSSAGEKILEEVLKEICNMIEDPQKVDVQRNLSSGCIQLKFEINEAKYDIVFAMAFPKVSAKVSCTCLPNQPNRLDFKLSTQNEKLHTAASILSTLRLCSGPQPSANPRATSDQCVQSAEAVSSELVNVPASKRDNPRDKALVEFSRAVCEKIKENFVIFGNVVDALEKLDKPGKRMELTFQHDNKNWLISIPVEFPEKSIRIFHVANSRGNRRYLVGPKDGRSISNLLEIVKVINNECLCTTCFRAKKM